MKAIKNMKNLDLREMAPFERHAKILGMWSSLKGGEVLRIINDHDPKPLHYQFDAEYSGQFEWEYEKSGPEDWIVKIRKIDGADETKRAGGAAEAKGVAGAAGNREEIKALIKQLHSKGDISKIKERGKDILRKVSPTDLAMIEQEIINEGVSRKEMRKLCDVHMEIMKENLGKAKADIKLKPGHPVHTLMEEHKVILEFVDKLKEVVKSLKSAKDFSKVGEEIEMLKHIAEHLIEAEKHHQREEDVLFPALEKAGVTEPPEIMREEHKELRVQKRALDKTAREWKKLQYPEFTKKVSAAAQYIVSELPNHIYKEDNILYPMALEVVPGDKWPDIKKRCDKIGYCCFTPEH